MEIVAPAGDYNRFLASVKAGGDAIYLGLKGIGARRKAPNFTLDELREAIDYAHLRGIRVYLTLNTIYKDLEIESLYENLKALYNHGIDAFIIQDLGMAKFLKDNFPQIEIHGSTQMTVSNHVEANYLYDLGFKRVVLSRELSFEDIKSIKEKSKIELEIFVSGALCVSYSGNCYMSSFIGSRSGNRGLCAQPCRKKYTCGQEEKYFFSPKDQLMGEKEIELLQSVGVESIKVEGRMKSEEYVYETVSYYRDLLEKNYRENESYKLFNRGYSKGYFYGENKELMNNNFSFDLGYLLGIIKGGKISLEDRLKLGDGVVYLDKSYNKIGGEYISKIILTSGDSVKFAEKGQNIILKAPKEAYYVHKTYDKDFYDKIEKALKEEKRKLPIEIIMDINKNKEINICFKHKNIVINLKGQVLEEAKKPISIEKIREKIEELGETAFYSQNTTINYDNEAFISFSYIKELKREASLKLQEAIISSYRRQAKDKMLLEKNYKNKEKKAKILVSVLNEKQYNFVKSLGIEEVYYKSSDVAKENKLSEIDLNTRLCGSLYQVLESKENKLWLDWNNNIINSYAFYSLRDIPNLEGIFISPELKKEDMEKIDSFSLKKGMLIYGKPRLMYIEKALEEDKKSILNEEKDKFIVIKNSLGNTEVYLDEALNLIPRLNEIEKMGFDVFKLEFTFENEDEIKEIVEALETREGTYKAYNFERGLY